MPFIFQPSLPRLCAGSWHSCRKNLSREDGGLPGDIDDRLGLYGAAGSAYGSRSVAKLRAAFCFQLAAVVARLRIATKKPFAELALACSPAERRRRLMKSSHAFPLYPAIWPHRRKVAVKKARSRIDQEMKSPGVQLSRGSGRGSSTLYAGTHYRVTRFIVSHGCFSMKIGGGAMQVWTEHLSCSV